MNDKVEIALSLADAGAEWSPKVLAAEVRRLREENKRLDATIKQTIKDHNAELLERTP